MAEKQTQTITIDDVSSEPQEVQDLAAAVHTDEVKAAYTELLAQQAVGV
jgi:hypothetical protein